MEDRKYITIWAGVLGDATNRSQAAKPLSPISPFAQNKPNSTATKIAVTSVTASNYAISCIFQDGKTNPIKPNLSQNKPNSNPFAKRPKIDASSYETINYGTKSAVVPTQTNPIKASFTIRLRLFEFLSLIAAGPDYGDPSFTVAQKIVGCIRKLGGIGNLRSNRRYYMGTIRGAVNMSFASVVSGDILNDYNDCIIFDIFHYLRIINAICRHYLKKQNL
jgi:hypothetical protein